MSKKNSVEKFWQKVSVKGADECWLYNGSLAWNGYGHHSCKGKLYKAHRYSWELHNGPIPEEMCVLHKCDNPSCVNPNHLFIGTQLENIRDRDNKRRVRHKLSNTQVNDIRNDSRMYKDIAQHYGVHPSTISLIKNNKIWKHNPPSPGQENLK